MSVRLNINPQLFQWAQQRSRISYEDLRTKFPQFTDWAKGEKSPTMKQLEKFAHFTHTPFGYFFLPAPPLETLPIPDFRTLTDQQVRNPSPNLLDTIHAVQFRQEWMKDFLRDEGEPILPFVGSHTLDSSHDVVAADMRKTLGLGPRWTRPFDTWEETLRTLVQKIEDIGVIVMINGIVENNTHRPLDVEEFRGFTLVDARAPIIFVNGADAKAAQMFTLVHELAHLWIGQEGVSDTNSSSPQANVVERFCNQVAAEFLVPANEMALAWKEVRKFDNSFTKLAGFFKVSPIVVARRLLELNLIDRAQYFNFYDTYRKDLAERRRRSSGGDFYRTLKSRLGRRFPMTVFSAAKSGRLQYGDAYQLTGVSGKTYDRFGEELGFSI